MELFSAFLTAVFYWVLIECWQSFTIQRAGHEAGPLLQEIALFRSARAWRVLGVFSVLIFLALVETCSDDGISPTLMFVCTLLMCGLVDFRRSAKARMEVRQDAIILKRERMILIPWNEIKYCRWTPTRGLLYIVRKRYADVTCRVAADLVDSATAILSRHVEVRDARGNMLASPTRNSDGTAHVGDLPVHRNVEFLDFQFDLRTMLLLMLAASAAFGWLAVRNQRYKQQEALLAKFAAFQPVERWRGVDVYDLDFSKCAKKPGDGDLVHLQEFGRLRFVELDGAPITDAGLQHLYALKTLHSLSLRNTQVTQAGVDELQRALRNAYISWSPPLSPPAPPPPTNPPPTE